VPADETRFDPIRILTVLDQCGVIYLLVGGFAAQAHGAHRQTYHIDLVPSTTDDNFTRVADALRRLNARLRVGGMTDEEARRLPVTIDVATLRSFGSSTWMTDAGPLDLLVELRDEGGGRHNYDELSKRRVANEIDGVIVQLAALQDIIASKEYAARDKDRDALPELHELLEERTENERNS
jgi:hypothetical protein